MTTDRGPALTMLLALSFTLLSLGACHAPSKRNSIDIDLTRVPSALRADYDSFAVNCSKCHTLARPLNAPVSTARQWDVYVARMIRNSGSAISPAEAPGILRFLHWYTDHYDRTSELWGEGRERPIVAAPQSVTAPVVPSVATPETREPGADADIGAVPAPPSMPDLNPTVSDPMPIEDPTGSDGDRTSEGEER